MGICTDEPQSCSILIVDHHRYWCNFAVDTLHEAGFIKAIGSNNYEIPQGIFSLVLLGCDSIGDSEADFIQDARRQQHPIVVAAMEGHESSIIRKGFVYGALDVLAKPLGKNLLLQTTIESLDYVERINYRKDKIMNSSNSLR